MSTECLFCCKAFKEQVKDRVLAEFEHCFVLLDQFPVSPGHILIIPKVHTEHWFTASAHIQTDMLRALDAMKARLDAEYRPDGYNVGLNCGKAAGQSVMHLHLHLIPRYRGDMDDPKGGVRGVIPSKQKY